MALRLVLVALVTGMLVAGGASASTASSSPLAIAHDEVRYRLDPEARLTVAEALADEAGWMHQSANPYRGRAGSIVVWARFDVPDVLARHDLLALTSAWERAEFHLLCRGAIVDRSLAGALVPLAERTLHVRMTPVIAFSGYVPLRVPPGCATPTVVARLSSEGRFIVVPRLRFELWDGAAVVRAERGELLFQGFVLGVVGFLIAYNLGLFVVTREASFAWYVAMEGAAILGWMTVMGAAMEWFWPAHPEWNYRVNWLALLVSFIALFQFLRSYLDLPARMPGLDKWLRRSTLTGVALSPVVILARWDAVSTGAAYASVAIALLLLATSIVLWRGRHPLRGNTILALASLGAGILVYVLDVAGWIPSTLITSHGAQLGSALMGIVLSWGLGLRLQRMRLEHAREKIELVETQNRSLEERVRSRTAELADAQAKSDELLANILPEAVIAELKAKGASEPRRYEDVSILFCDFVGFTQAVATMPPARIVRELDDIFSALDDIVAAEGLEKIKTIGDAYMAAAGVPIAAPDHAVRAVRAAISITRFVAARNERTALKWNVRLGVHSGDVVAGIVGRKKYAFDIWGDTVNLASRLESASSPGRVNISAYTCALVEGFFDCEYRGKVNAKGKGDIDMYYVLGERSDAPVPNTVA